MKDLSESTREDKERFERVQYGTRLLHHAVEPLWDELREPKSKRGFAVRGFANIVRQHVTSQYVLAGHHLDISAISLVRPAFEALVRSIWAIKGAEDSWINGFFEPHEYAVSGDAETRKGPDVDAMLRTIELHHPKELHRALLELKEVTWRAMNSYVHGGIRPVVQSFVSFPYRQVGSSVINANGMLITATNVARMADGLASPTIPLLQCQYADCLPPISVSN